MEKVVSPDITSSHQAVKTSGFDPPCCQYFLEDCISDFEPFPFLCAITHGVGYEDDNYLQIAYGRWGWWEKTQIAKYFHVLSTIFLVKKMEGDLKE